MVKLYFKGECTKFLNLSETGDPEDPETKEKPVSVKLEGVENLPERESAPAKEEVKPVITETEDDKKNNPGEYRKGKRNTLKPRIGGNSHRNGIRFRRNRNG